jgi:hypothetical protein
MGLVLTKNASDGAPTVAGHTERLEDGARLRSEMSRGDSPRTHGEGACSIVMDERRRMRMVSFRVSPGEFELLKVRSQSEGARSISDYARLVLLRQELEPHLTDTTIQELLDAIQQLRNDLHHADDTGGRRRMLRARLKAHSKQVRGA